MVMNVEEEDEQHPSTPPSRKSVQTRKDQDKKQELEKIYSHIERSRAFSQMDENSLLSCFHINQLGFMKRKETKATMHKQEILGLNNRLRNDGYPMFDDVLFGETRQNPVIQKNINLVHNFQPQYLAKSQKGNQGVFEKFFRKIQGYIVLTNYRLLFIPKPDQALLNQMTRQHKFVKEFFNIPLGYISRIEK